MPTPTNVQMIELGLIKEDIDDLLALLELVKHEHRGYLSLALSPLISFIIGESNIYLRSQKLTTDSPELFTRHKEAVKKSRALLKLFDTNHGGMESLIELLDLFQNKTTEWMNIRRSGLRGFIGKSLQPNLGIYFLDKNPIYMTTVGLSAFGKTKGEIASFTEHAFDNVSAQSQSYGIALGECIESFHQILNFYNIPATSKGSQELSINLNMTHNDFHAKKLYLHIASEVDIKVRFTPVFFFILSQVNIASSLLPKLLPPNSNILFRLQFLTAYHATRSLLQIESSIHSDLNNSFVNSSGLFGIPNIAEVRNTLAHYGLGRGIEFVINDSDVLDNVTKGLCNLSKQELLERSNLQLEIISQLTHKHISKDRLKKVKAIFGNHT